MSRLRSLMGNAILWISIIPLILLMAALYWSCRIFGLDLDDDF